MTSKEAAVYRLKQLKGKPLKAKAEHLFAYYRGPLLAVLIALLLYGYLLFHFATHKDEVLHVVCLNSFAKAESADLFCREFAQALQKTRLSQCPWLTTGMDGHMTAMEWNQLLREAVAALDERQQKLPYEKLLGK